MLLPRGGCSITTKGLAVRIATVIIAAILLFQSFYMLALSTREGFSSITLVALGVALAPLLVLLIVYSLVRRRPAGIRILMISGAIIFLVMESLLPVSPFKTTVTTALQKRALQAVEISNVRDEPFHSPKGNPVGVRISFEAVFPRGGQLSVSPTLRAMDERYHHYQTSMGHLAGTTVTPEPEKDDAGGYRFTPGGRYRFTADFYPIFLFIANTGGRGLEKGDLCLSENDTQTLSVHDLRALLREPIATAYSVEVKVSGNTYFMAPGLPYSGTTTGSYSLKTSYESALREAAQPCPW